MYYIFQKLKIIKYVLVCPVFFLLNCDNSNKQTETEHPQQTTFTITVKDKGEFAYVYFSEKTPDPKTFKHSQFFRLDTKECLQLNASQFRYLSLYVTRFAIITAPKSISADVMLEGFRPKTALCTVDQRCPPNHYEIMDNQDTFIDDFELHVVQEKTPAEISHCTAIKQWMKQKMKPFIMKYNELGRPMKDYRVNNIEQIREWETEEP